MALAIRVRLGTTPSPADFTAGISYRTLGEALATDPTFTAADALKVTTELRDMLGLPPEQFPAQAFVGMISDEIEQLRGTGHDDKTIADLVSKAVGKTVSSDLITRYYASPADRGRAGR